MKRSTLSLWLVSLLLVILPAFGKEVAKIGIYAGTFDPLHDGHLNLAREAATHLGLDKVLIVPNASNKRKPGMSPLAERHPAIADALRELGDSRLELLPQEAIEAADAGGPPGDAPRRLLDAASTRHPGATVFQILGSDSFWKILEKNDLPKPGEKWVIAVKPRAGEPPLDPRIVGPLQQKGILTILPEGEKELSSTAVRKAAKAGNWVFLKENLSPAVFRHVVLNGMYGIASSPGWLDALLALDPDNDIGSFSSGAGMIRCFPIPAVGNPGGGFPEVSPDSHACSIDPGERHTLGDLQAYVRQRLTPLGMMILGHHEVRIQLVKGLRSRVGDLLLHHGIRKAIEVTRSRDYITLGIVLGKDRSGEWRAFIGDIYGRSRLLHTEAMISVALRCARRPPDDFTVVDFPAGVKEADFLREVFRSALERVPPGVSDLAIIGYHWKVQQQMNLRLAAWKRYPSHWSVLDGRIAAGMARFKPEMRRPQTLPQWPRRHFEGWDLPFSFLFFQNSRGDPFTVLLTRNVYGDQLPALMDVLYREKGVRRFVLFGSGGALDPELAIGDLVAPREVSSKCLEGRFVPVSFRWAPARLRSQEAERPIRFHRFFSVWSPLEETSSRIESFRRAGVGVVDVELGFLPVWLNSVGKSPVEVRCLTIVSDLPGSDRSLEKLSESETELNQSFRSAVDRILQEFDLVAPSDHRIPRLERP